MLANDLSAASVFFNKAYKGTGSLNQPQSNTISITTPISILAGSNFKFTSNPQSAVSFSAAGNECGGTLTYTNASNVQVTILG